MDSIIRQLQKIRETPTMNIDTDNTNRYTVLMHENKGRKTAYCFSTPIYNDKTCKVVNFTFEQKGGAFTAFGTNTSIEAAQSIALRNDNGVCEIIPNQALTGASKRQLQYGSDRVFLTTNGICYTAQLGGDASFVDITLKVENPHMKIWSNNKAFSLMISDYRPHFVLSVIGGVDAQGRVIAPATMNYTQSKADEYHVRIAASNTKVIGVMFEANVYEEKLFQDTTVESGQPYMNNVYGGTAFLGQTADFGEQWLYSRLDLNKISEFLNVRVENAKLYIPCFYQNGSSITAHRLLVRFCSIGSAWDNKVVEVDRISEGYFDENYCTVDLTGFITNPKTQYICKNEGWILRQKTKKSGFTALATGDSYFAPQILEIQYR